MKRTILVFLVCFLAIACIFFLLPINLFDGEIVFNVNGIERIVKAKLSLSYFIGIGASGEDLKDVKDFYLLPMGYFMVFLLVFAFPALIAYRISLRKSKKEA